MADGQTTDELFYVNGINASTGAYIEDPLTPQEVAAKALDLEKKRSEDEIHSLKKRADRAVEKDFRPVVGVDERDFEQTGWGVIFARGANPGVKDALQELLDHRKEQAGDLYRVYDGDHGYLLNDSWETFRRNRHVSTGQADPKEMPYYLLIVGDPETIPYSFQYQLNVERAVGRIHFDSLADYAYYAHSVVEAEKHPVRLPRRATFFATSNCDDPATLLSSADLVAPLKVELAKELVGQQWELGMVEPSDARRDRLKQLLGGSETPALLFTATHGAGFNRDDPRHRPHQGALVTQEWPGPRAPREPLKREFYFSADDVPDDARLWGLIAVFFACFGAGTPRLNDFFHLKERQPEERLQLAERAFLAPLPQRLLSHPKGGALAVVGHVERAWTSSFKAPGISGPEGHDIKAFKELLSLLMRGFPLGSAMEDVHSRYAQYSTELTSTLFPVTHQDMPFTDDLKSKVARLWTANNDARNYVIIGDPAVRLPVSDTETARAEHPTVSSLKIVMQRSGEHAAPGPLPGAESSKVETQENMQPVHQPDKKTGRPGDETDRNFLPLPVPPTGAQADSKLYEYWREHIKSGFERNDEMFHRILEAFLGPYHTTVWMYRILFAVGVLSFVTAVGLSVWSRESLYALVFGGLSVVAFLSYFLSRPLRSLEENLEFITWLGIIYNTYWTRLVYAMDQATIQQDLEGATKEAIAEIEHLIETHAALSSKRPGADGQVRHPQAAVNPKPGKPIEPDT